MSSGSEDDTEGMCTFVVVRTTDAKKQELTLPLSTKLGELKKTLSSSEYFGPIPEDASSQQRIFHLGREWKSHGRTLEKLGLGRFDNKILHLQQMIHVKKGGDDIKQQAKSTAATKPKGRKRSTRQQQQRTSSTTTTTTSSSGTSGSAAAAAAAASAAPKTDSVIELLDDSDEEVVEIPRPTTRRNSKRRRVS